MYKLLLLLFLLSNFLKANNIILNRNINNYGIINNIINSTDSVRLENEKRIIEVANKLINYNLKPTERNTLEVVIENAKKLNNYNLSNVERRKQCIEYSAKIKFIKIDLKLAKKICNEIFK
jgi:hypothetical protein